MTLGTQVEWGSIKQKRGVIVAVIPAGANVHAHLTGLQRCMADRFGTLPRAAESYVVHVEGKGAGALYWPHTKHLREVPE